MLVQNLNYFRVHLCPFRAVIQMSLFIHVCIHSYNSFRTTECFFIKFIIGKFYEVLSSDLIFNFEWCGLMTTLYEGMYSFMQMSFCVLVMCMAFMSLPCTCVFDLMMCPFMLVPLPFIAAQLLGCGDTTK